MHGRMNVKCQTPLFPKYRTVALYAFHVWDACKVIISHMNDSEVGKNNLNVLRISFITKLCSIQI